MSSDGAILWYHLIISIFETIYLTIWRNIPSATILREYKPSYDLPSRSRLRDNYSIQGRSHPGGNSPHVSKELYDLSCAVNSVAISAVGGEVTCWGLNIWWLSVGAGFVTFFIFIYWVNFIHLQGGEWLIRLMIFSNMLWNANKKLSVLQAPSINAVNLVMKSCLLTFNCSDSENNNSSRLEFLE